MGAIFIVALKWLICLHGICCVFYSYSLQKMLSLWQTGDVFETMHSSCYAEHTGILETFITRTILLGLCGTVILYGQISSSTMIFGSRHKKYISWDLGHSLLWFEPIKETVWLMNDTKYTSSYNCDIVADFEDQPRCWLQENLWSSIQQLQNISFFFQCWIGWSSANLELRYLYGQILGSTVMLRIVLTCSTQNFHQNFQILTSWWRGFMNEKFGLMISWWKFYTNQLKLEVQT